MMRVLVLGATGFIGNHLVERLLSEGHEVRGLARHKDALARFGSRIDSAIADITDPATLRGTARGCDASVNLVGLLRERRRKGLTYERVVVGGTRNWLRECEDSGVKRVVYVSALGADPRGTGYQRSKWEAEQLARSADLEWTIVRPSFVSGEAGAMPQLASLLKFKLVPSWGKQDYFFDPVDVEDLAMMIAKSLKSAKARRRVYSVGGPDRVSYKEMLTAIGAATGRKPWFIRTPWVVAYLLGFGLGWMPFFPATLENFRLLRQGSEAPDREWSKDLGITPTRFQDSLRRHLSRKSR